MTHHAALGSLLLLLAAPSAQAQAFPFFLDVDVCWGQLGNFANRGTQCDPIDPYTTNQTVFLVEAGGVTTQCTYDPFGGPGWVSAFQGTWSKSGNQVTMYSPEWNWYFVGALAGGGTSGGVMVDSYGLATPVQSQQGAWDGTKAGQAEWDACVNGMGGGGGQFQVSQVIDGATVTCAATVNTPTYTECQGLLADGLYFPNGITCGPQWSFTNSAYSDTVGFCAALTGVPMAESLYVCDYSQLRATWFSGVWGTTYDNGFTESVRCYY